jgi:hypothetical protein
MKDGKTNDEDIVNLDETGIQMMPTWKRTLAEKGVKQVAGVAKKCLAQITKVSAISLTGVLLPYMLIFAGKTEAVIPTDIENEPEGIEYTCTPSHFANARTTLLFMKKILVPYIERNRRTRITSGKSTEAEEAERWAILVWDNFSAHLDPEVTLYLNENRIKSLLLPPNCTSRYQPLDVLINGAEKRLITKHFSEWYFQALSAASKENPPRYNVLPKSSACKRRFIATLIAGVHNTMAGRTIFIRAAWLKSTLLHALAEYMDVNDPVVEHEDDIIQRSIVSALMGISLSGDQEDADTTIELSEVTQSEDAVDIVDHINLVTLLTNFDEVEPDSEDDHLIEEQEVDEDSSSDFLPEFSVSLQQDHASNISATSCPSEASCGLIEFDRPSTGGLLRVKFPKGPVLSPQQLAVLLSKQKSEWKRLVLSTASNFTSDGYDIKLKNVPHGSVAMEMPSLSYIPTAIHALQQSEYQTSYV